MDVAKSLNFAETLRATRIADMVQRPHAEELMSTNGFRFVPVEDLDGTPPLIIGLSGMSDSGKTYSALMIAKAVAKARGGIVCAIDTEGRMAKYRDARVYAELHPFRAVRWTPPFSGDRAIEACNAAVAAGAGCIILDSASDEWEGDGGVLQSQEAHLQRLAGDDYRKRERMNMPAWAKAKSPHQRWHAYLLGLSACRSSCAIAPARRSRWFGAAARRRSWTRAFSPSAIPVWSTT